MGASRTAIELYVDMHLINRQLIQDAVEKFFVFRRAQQLKAARRMIDFYVANPALRARSLDVFRDFVTNARVSNRRLMSSSLFIQNCASMPHPP